MADSTTPLCTWAQFTSGAFKDLARNIIDQQAQADLLLEATRLCEQEADRRFAPFTSTTETHPARGIDPRKYGSCADLPGDPARTIRRCWLNEYAPRYSEFWTYSNVSVQAVRPYGGSQTLTTTQITGPDADSGLLWFDFGLPIPLGSIVKATYSGGYTTMPADLVRAGKFMVAELLVRELAPTSQARDPDLLHANAVSAIVGYIRN
jgi:hypothetical protein